MTMRTLLTRGLAALVVAGSLAAVAPAAQAETWHATDRWHDVQSMRVTGHGPIDPTPRNRSADITALTIDHGTTWLTATVRVRDLAPRDRVVAVPFLLPDGVDGTLGARTVDGKTSASAEYLVGMDIRTCPATVAIQPRRGVVRLAVRRACLGDPAWVRATRAS